MKMLIRLFLLGVGVVTFHQINSDSRRAITKNYSLQTHSSQKNLLPSAEIIQHSKVYNLSSELLDVVFVCHQKDLQTLDLAIEGIKKNCQQIRRIIVVSATRLTDLAEWFDEKNYPFTQEDIALELFNHDHDAAKHYIAQPHSRIGWIYQQFLKLYALFVIPQISSNILIIDADTIFLNPVAFIDQEGHAYYNSGRGHHEPFFTFGARLLTGFSKVFEEHSGIAHHMVFQRAIMEDLFATITATHQQEPWKALCACIDHKELEGSALSEYELYFNFAFSKTKQVHLRRLEWANIKFDAKQIKAFTHQGYHYVSCHSYL